ncbi:hypothetical protein LCGC14_0784440 [marine sediment metagenome]|uniref:Uncharacterized protein n=1 Tax=marine sediment metagenome TaxID=412755 RepID=A0A0F9PUR5_9ZZZZ|nr:hypothetical protein [Phycisphaerae bacterium]
MAVDDQQWQVDVSKLVLRGDEMATEWKLIIGGALIASGYYWKRRQRSRGPMFSGPNLMPDLFTMAGGVVVAGAVREMFWPTYKALPAQFMKQFEFKTQGDV